MCLLLALLLLTGCASIRPIVKIGLIAPFEGLYRESGYAALDAMRRAMRECTPPGVDVLPLALDASGDPAEVQRTAQKLLVDPTVRAIVGPLLLDAIPAVTTVITPASTVAWFLPPLMTTEDGAGDFSSGIWLETQVEHIASHTSASRLLLAGLSTGWQPEIKTPLPTVRVDDLDNALATLTENDAVLWLGRPDVGARWLAALRQEAPTIEFWLALQAGHEIFAAHTTDQSNVYWLLLTNSEYNRRSQLDDSALQPAEVMGALTYRATCAAIDTLTERQTATSTMWQLQSRPLVQLESE